MKKYERVKNYVETFVKNNSKHNVEVYTLTKHMVKEIVKNLIIDTDYYTRVEATHHYHTLGYSTILNKLKNNNIYFEISEFNDFGKIDKISLIEFDGEKFNSIENAGDNHLSVRPLDTYKAISGLNKYYKECKDDNLIL